MQTNPLNAPALAAATIWIGIAGSMIPHWTAAYAQSLPVFEVSRSIAASRGRGISRTPLKIAFKSALLPDMMAFAYGLPVDRIERRPQWMYDDRYDVAVTTTAAAPLAEQKLMLQKLFAERFGLVVHRFSYQSPVYFLVPGAKVNLTPAQEPDAPGLPEFRLMRPELGAASTPYRLSFAARHVSMSDLAEWLYPQLQLPVMDKTGITGLFDIQITGLPLNGGAERIIRAVQESLGLNLELHNGTAESLIIDQAQPLALK